MTDYYARRDYVYSSGNRYFSVPFSYIDKEHIHVFINEEETENFTFLNDSQISITPTLTAGDVVSVRRYTPIDERMVVFSNTSILSKDVQNLDSTQMFNAVQEIYDNNVAFKADLDNRFDDYKDGIDDSISSIETTANTALSNSQSAVSTANSAETKADNAVSTANTANTNASNAVSTANTALTNSQSAVSTANSAVTTANNAVSTADDAVTTATYASDKVDEFGESIGTVIEAAEQIDELQQAIEETQQAAEDAQAAAAQAESAAAELVIDQTFDGTSTHAQSGVAIAGELSTNYQSKLVSGTDIKTINNTNLLGSGNINISEVFIATYNTTSFSEIETAYNAGKPVFVSYNNFLIPMVHYNSSRIEFRCIDRGSGTHNLRSLEITAIPNGSSTTWNNATEQLELTTNKVTSISTSSTDTQYPSAKCVYGSCVIKSGDTMSGSLQFSKIGGGVIALNAISEGGYSDIQYTKTDGLRAGFIRANNVSSTERNIQISACNDSGTPTSSFVLKCNNNINSCTFPNTTCVDGQWVNTHILLTTSTAIGSYRLDLSSYLPNDGYKYEIMVSGLAYCSTSTYANLFLDNAHGDYGAHFVARVGTNSRMACINCTLPVDNGRDIYLNIKDHALTSWEPHNGWEGLYLVGYRRIGTNA